MFRKSFFRQQHAALIRFSNLPFELSRGLDILKPLSWFAVVVSAVSLSHCGQCGPYLATECNASEVNSGQALLQERDDANDELPPPPKMTDYDRQLKAFIKNSRRKDPIIENAAIYNLWDLHRFVVADGRYPANKKMVSIRNSIVRRLSEWEDDFRKLQRRSESTDSKRTSFGLEAQTNSEAFFEPSAQLDQNPLLPSDASELEIAMLLAAQDSNGALGDLTGGPGQVFAYSGGQFGPPWDHSDELIELLQTMVTPDSWQSNGGNATMMYFQPSQALVVRASQRTQDKVCEMLYLLRAAF